MPERDYIQEEEKHNINAKTWQDSSNLTTQAPHEKEITEANSIQQEAPPKASKEEQLALEKWRNSSDFQAGLQDILPTDTAATPSEQDINLRNFIEKWQREHDESEDDNSEMTATENTTGLPDDLKSGLEALSGISLDDVKVYYNSPLPALYNTHAFAQGTNIYIGPGQKKHLAHEAWHVIQQKQGRVKPTLQMEVEGNSVDVNQRKDLESEAEKIHQQVPVGNDKIQQVANSNKKKKGKKLGTKNEVLQGAFVTPHTTKINDEKLPNESNGGKWSGAELDASKGSPTNGDVRAVSSAVQNLIGGTWVAGHMLNKHLGGSGTNWENITAISSADNSAHHSQVERSAKEAFANGELKEYWTVITERATLVHKGTNDTIDGLASKMNAGWKDSNNKVQKNTVINLGPRSGIPGVENWSVTYKSTGHSSGELASSTTKITSEETYYAMTDGVVSHYITNPDDAKKAVNLLIVNDYIPNQPIKKSFDEEDLMILISNLLIERRIDGPEQVDKFLKPLLLEALDSDTLML
ncbi:eCIS core domain-containing protein [Aureispira anguillae]|uniref:DUF4157 domain-containing protein n=1 Tax=Aureispira anguillae TaxID=2864201 RepID=A0A916DNN2_9BACT|nr:DUF4157 domain-containing protein [Aureispira anguillae]BDS09999.1 DUF4157 domain-containing protein [Aureispira anguillae]